MSDLQFIGDFSLPPSATYVMVSAFVSSGYGMTANEKISQRSTPYALQYGRNISQSSSTYSIQYGRNITPSSSKYALQYGRNIFKKITRYAQNNRVKSLKQYINQIALQYGRNMPYMVVPISSRAVQYRPYNMEEMHLKAVHSMLHNMNVLLSLSHNC
jgi:hypothetical protein